MNVLTKEQIIQEGWISSPAPSNDPDEFLMWGFLRFKKDNWNLGFDVINSIISIAIADLSLVDIIASPFNYYDYTGPCNSIDDLKFLMKLLEI